MFASLNCELKHLVMENIPSYIFFLLVLVPIEFEPYIISSEKCKLLQWRWGPCEPLPSSPLLPDETW